MSFQYLKENESYLTEQLITYIGNKRSILNHIGENISYIKKRLNKIKLKTFDVFSGSGIIGRYLKQFSELVIANDMEKYAETINNCYLSNSSKVDLIQLTEYYSNIKKILNLEDFQNGFISELYAPENNEKIKKNERVFYTTRNAKYIDTARQLIQKIPKTYQPYLLAPLLSEASIHVNTCGVFKGFYKNKNGVGQFGGEGKNALLRIKGNIELPFPVFSNFECEYKVFCGDSNKIVEITDEVDLSYIDPPYNQHPYGSNYFMLNLINNYNKPTEISKVSGIPISWNKSLYNKNDSAHFTLQELITKIKSKFIIISFNSDGFIKQKEMINMLKTIGKTKITRIKYNTFRGSRNLNKRTIHVKEYLYLVEKK